MRLAAIAACFFALLTVPRLSAQSSRSLTDSDNGILFAQGTTISVPTADENDSNDDAQGAQEQVLLLRSTVKALTDSLAIANSEAEMFKRQAADQTLKLEALGLAGVERDQSKIEQRLLAAVRDLRVQKKQNEDAINELVRLTEAIQVMTQSAEKIDPQVRLAVETELRKTNEILGSPTTAPAASVEPTLNDGMVVDLKEDLSLIVTNMGEKQGVKIGMPFQVMRNDKLIGEVRIIDVRSRISGAIIQSLDSEKVPIQVGDRLKVDAHQ